jgi:hypothetical protein
MGTSPGQAPAGWAFSRRRRPGNGFRDKFRLRSRPGAAGTRPSGLAPHRRRRVQPRDFATSAGFPCPAPAGNLLTRLGGQPTD